VFRWYRDSSAVERTTFWACFAGWALDAMDVQMFSLVIPALIAGLGMDKSQAGLLGGVTLVASALGGWVAGAASDRFGRVRTLQVTILWFAGFTFLCAFAPDFRTLIVLKALQGFGFGGEWAAGAVLMAEAIRPASRGRALGTVQGAWAAGWAAAVLLYTLLFTLLDQALAWRVMFAAGLLPALLVVFVRRSVPEPELALPGVRSRGAGESLLAIFSPEVLRVTLLGAVLGMGAHGGYYALMTWIPTFLKTERHLSVLGTGGYLAVMIVAFACGCLASAQLLDRIGRRRNIALFAACCVVTAPVYLMFPLTDTQMLVLGFPLGFFSAGIPASLGTLFNELYPARMRGAGVGFCYNFGRVASAAFPVLVGYMSKSMPLGEAIGIDAAIAYGVVVVTALLLPETKGRSLQAA